MESSTLPTPPRGASAAPVIATRALSKRYKKIEALAEVSLEVPEGTCFGLLGPNGAGKSTLVKTLLGIVHPSSGSATMLGSDIRSHRARHGVGYLPEGHQFPRYLSGIEVCRYFGKLAGLGGAELEREVEEKLALVGMTERAGDKVTKYSKGMKQRVGLAQAMLGNPRLVFLDEPTDGVDPVGRKEIREVIRRVCTQGVTVFLNSHLLSEVEMICDRVAILDKGRVLAEGTVDELKARMGSAADGLVVTFKTSPVPEPLWSTLEARGARKSAEGEFLVGVPDHGGMSALIDDLRRADVEIYAVVPKVSTLEDAFVELLAASASREVPRG